MMDDFTEDQISRLSDFVASSMGLYFPRGRWSDLERQSKLAAREFGFASAGPFLEWLTSSPINQEQVEMLASYLTISETYFWREPRSFEALRDQILPELIRSRETNGRWLRLWSAGCATGEEPYSIAIALCETLPAWKDWRITLLATDINPHILRKASAGVFGQWSFRNSPAGFREKYFSPMAKDKYEVNAEIRNMVTFAYLNLVADTFPTPMNDTNAMDVIFCRNVLMYFAPARAKLVGQQLFTSLVEGGWFIVSASELSQQTFSQFASINFPGAIAYRRESGKPQAAEYIPAGEPAPVQRMPVQPQVKEAAYVAPTALLPLPPPLERILPARSVDEIPKAPPADRGLIVRELANQGRLAEAWAACEGALAADKLNPGLHYLGANILQELNREDEAMAAFKRVLYLDPNFLLANFSLGNLAQRRGNAAAAQKSFRNVLALLEAYRPEDILPEAEGLTAGRLREIIRATLQMGALSP